MLFCLLMPCLPYNTNNFNFLLETPHIKHVFGKKTFHVDVLKDVKNLSHAVSFFFPSALLTCCAFLPNLILEVGTPFQAMTGLTAFIDSLLAQVFRGFPQL